MFPKVQQAGSKTFGCDRLSEGRFMIWIIAGWLNWFHHIPQLMTLIYVLFVFRSIPRDIKKGTTKHSSLGMVISQCSVARIGSPDLNPSDLALLFVRKVVKSYPEKTLNQFRLVNYVILTLPWNMEVHRRPQENEFNLLASGWCQLFISERSLNYLPYQFGDSLRMILGAATLISIVASEVLPPPKEIGSLPEAPKGKRRMGTSACCFNEPTWQVGFVRWSEVLGHKGSELVDFAACYLILVCHHVKCLVKWRVTVFDYVTIASPACNWDSGLVSGQCSSPWTLRQQCSLKAASKAMRVWQEE